MKKATRWIIGGSLVAAGTAVLLSDSKWHLDFVDATARKPSGWIGRHLYEDPKAHYKSFKQLLDKLQLNQDESLLDICCGGGSLLTRALKRVRRAAGIDHSADMVAVTRESNAGAIAAGRLDVRQGDAAALPWDEASFDAVANANAFFFLSQPEAVLREAYRVLKPGGRLALATTAKHRFTDVLLGPWRSSMALYTDDELVGMLREAGFSQVEAYSSDGLYQIGYGVKA